MIFWGRRTEKLHALKPTSANDKGRRASQIPSCLRRAFGVTKPIGVSVPLLLEPLSAARVASSGSAEGRYVVREGGSFRSPSVELDFVGIHRVEMKVGRRR